MLSETETETGVDTDIGLLAAVAPGRAVWMQQPTAPSGKRKRHEGREPASGPRLAYPARRGVPAGP